eukprot:883192-Amphidinium_carterae.1
MTVGVVMIANYQRLLHMLRSFGTLGMWLRSSYRRLIEEASADWVAIRNAALFFGTEILIVFSRRCPCCRSSMRRAAIRGQEVQTRALPRDVLAELDACSRQWIQHDLRVLRSRLNASLDTQTVWT